MIETIAIAGGLFAVLSFIHFVADWVFQSHFEAINKHKNSYIRAIHCVVYCVPFIIFLSLIGVSGWSFMICVLTLYFSHFIIDTYIPVYLWAKWLRRIPELQREALKVDTEDNTFEDPKEAFKELWNKPINPILFIAIDQILHLSFLWVVVFVILL